MFFTVQVHNVLHLVHRFNKLGLDVLGPADRRQKVDEVHSFTKVTSAPLCDLIVKQAAFGTSHTAFLTGKQIHNINNNIMTVFSFINDEYRLEVIFEKIENF